MLHCYIELLIKQNIKLIKRTTVFCLFLGLWVNVVMDYKICCSTPSKDKQSERRNYKILQIIYVGKLSNLNKGDVLGWRIQNIDAFTTRFKQEIGITNAFHYLVVNDFFCGVKRKDRWMVFWTSTGVNNRQYCVQERHF